MSQPIELGGKRGRRIDSARAATRVSGYELAEVRRQLLFQVKKSFSDAQTARDSLALAEQNVSSLDEVERIQRVRAEKGDISELELLRIQVQRYVFERDAADARQALQAAKVALRSAVGRDAIAEDFEIVGELTVREFPAMPTDLYPLAMPIGRISRLSGALSGASTRTANRSLHSSAPQGLRLARRRCHWQANREDRSPAGRARY
jgi:outer membrane protein TolC